MRRRPKDDTKAKRINGVGAGGDEEEWSNSDGDDVVVDDNDGDVEASKQCGLLSSFNQRCCIDGSDDANDNADDEHDEETTLRCNKVCCLA